MYTRGSYVVSQEDEENSSESSCSSSPPPSPSSDFSSPEFESFSDIDSPPFSPLDSHIESCEDEDSHVESVKGGSLLMQDEEDEEEEMMRNSATWYGYIITSDNIEKGTTASHQRQEQKSKSLHYFHSYAAKDRVNLEHLSDEMPSPKKTDPAICLPSCDDVRS